MQGKILVVHRNEPILDVVREMFQDLGYAVTQAQDGHRALGKALSTHYHFIIVNHALNGNLNGSQLVERMKKYGVQTPIIGTAPGANWATPVGFAAGTVDYLLPSPFENAELIKAVETLSKTRRTNAVKDMPNEPLEQDLFAAPELPGLPTLDTESDLFETLMDGESDLLEDLTDTTSSIPDSDALLPESTQPESPFQVPEPPGFNGKPHILLAQTDARLTSSLQMLLKKEGFEVSAFKNGREAYEDAMVNSYDFILTDLWLPGMDGFDMIDAMRKSGVDAPIAILTAHVTREMVQELIAYRICRILLKSTSPKEIVSLVHAKVRYRQ